jgi:hypothetical protein
MLLLRVLIGEVDILNTVFGDSAICLQKLNKNDRKMIHDSLNNAYNLVK